MKNKILFLLMMLPNAISGQIMLKRKIDTSDFKLWHSISNFFVNDDGGYYNYTVSHVENGLQLLIIKSSSSPGQIEVPGGKACFYLPGNKHAGYLLNNKLHIVHLPKGQIKEVIDSIQQYKTVECSDKWLIYRKTNSADLHLINLNNKQTYSLESSETFWINEKTNEIIYIKNISEYQSSIIQQKLCVLNLHSGDTKDVWYGDRDQRVDNLIISGDGLKVAFKVTSNKDNYSQVNSIWLYESIEIKARVISNNDPNFLDSNAQISELVTFSKEGNRIFLNISWPEKSIPNSEIAEVNVWSYMDASLQAEQLKKKAAPKYLYALNLENSNLIQIENRYEKLIGSIQKYPNDNYVLTNKQLGEDGWWNENSTATVNLISTTDGKRTIIKENLPYNANSCFNYLTSPSGKFILFFDPVLKDYQVYEISTGRTINITKDLNTEFQSDEYINKPGYPRPVENSVIWFDANSALLYDNYDIWKFDLNSISAPKNITNGFGKRNKIKLRLCFENQNREIQYIKKDQILITAFDKQTKYNGFYAIDINHIKDPALLTIGPYNYCRAESQAPSTGREYRTFYPIKLKKKNIWVVRRMSIVEAPNYFLTSDFKFFKPLTNIQPHNNFNWINAELITYKMLDSQLTQGLLYKPENFIPEKKYPIIFNYYESQTDGIFDYLYPDYMSDNINIPYYVSNGYLVFLPDIKFKQERNNGESAINAIIGATKLLSKYKWVDTSKMGIQGHSFGGYLTNYLITHCKEFSAACEGAGTSNLISSYGQLTGYGTGRQYANEMGHQGSGFGKNKTPWTFKDLYIKASPIFSIDYITTPLLMMHCRKDPAVPFEQAIEMYSGARRAGKKVWLLEYDDGDHSLSGRESIDYTIRVKQFFDHYLFDQRPPTWMTTGVPAYLKGIVSGLQLDNKRKCGKDCQTCKTLNLE